MRKLLEARGERLMLNFCYISFTHAQKRAACPPNLQFHHRNPEEYAEFILAVSEHVRRKYGISPDVWELVLEPDNKTVWTGTDLGRALAAAGRRLRAAGFAATFAAPSAKTLANAVTLFEEIARVPGAVQYVSEISYHRYGGAISSRLGELVALARRHGVRTSMLEHIGSGYEDLHMDLKVGMVSSWEQFALAGPRPGDPGGRYFLVDARAPGGPVVRVASRTPFLRQYFRYVRSGAVRIGAESTAPAFDPVAFVNEGGGQVVVVKAEAGGAFEVHGLPAGTYGITFATIAEPEGKLRDVTVAAGGPLRASIPGRGVATVFARR
jgi:hypothetical protein